MGLPRASALARLERAIADESGLPATLAFVSPLPVQLQPENTARVMRKAVEYLDGIKSGSVRIDQPRGSASGHLYQGLAAGQGGGLPRGWKDAQEWA